MRERRTTSGGVSWVDRISCGDGELVVALPGTGRVDVVVVGVVVSVEAAVLRPKAKGNCVVENGLGRRRGREDAPSIMGVPTMPGRQVGLWEKAERLSAVVWVSPSWASWWCETSLG